MTYTLRAAAAATAFFAVTVSACAQTNPGAEAWYGSYDYEFDGGETAGGSAISLTYRLQLDASGCSLTIEGFQTAEDIRCTARMNGDNLRIGFLSYADGGNTNQYGVVRYANNTHLFTLVRAGEGLTTRLGEVRPDGAQATGRAFARTPG